ncbi:MAG: CHASE2 domain-containing protein [Actinomycetota bacterium]
MWERLRQAIWDWRGVMIVAPSMAGLVITLRFAGLLQIFELAAFDQFTRLRPAEPPDSRIVIVEIREADLRKLKQWPISDAILAKLIENIKAQQPVAIGLDLYRNFPVEPGYQQLLKVFTSTPNFIGIRKVAGDREGRDIPPPPGLKYPAQVAANDVPIDPDGKIRRAFLTLPVAPEKAVNEQDKTLDGLGVKLALKYLATKGIVPELLNANKKSYKLGQATLIPFTSDEGGYVHADASGYQLLLNYRGPAGSFATLSMTEVLENRISPNQIRGHLVLIGVTAESLQDTFYIPYSSTILSIPKRMPGVEIHANFASQLLSAALEGRSMIKTWNESIEWLWIFGWSLVGAILTWTQRSVSGNPGKSWTVVSLFLAGISLIFGSYLAFLNSWWIPLIPPFLALTGSVIAITAYIARTASEIRKTFGRYLTDEVVASLLEHPEGLKLGGERRTLTILTSDLRGFTATSERLSPEEVIKILNFYLGHMADVITFYNGTIDEFMGDGILVLFGAPTARKNDAQRAVACAVAMQLALFKVNEQMKAWGYSPLEMGIGINTGEVVVGNIGSEKRTKYGVVGSQVNLTYRIESYTTGGQILVSQSTLEAAGDIVQIEGQKQVTPKGVKEPIMIYQVGGIAGEYHLFLPKVEEVFLGLAQPIICQYWLLDEKDVSNSGFQGKIVEISEKCAKICSNDIHQKLPNPLSNIKLSLLLLDDSTESENIYAKVLEIPAEAGSFYIRFTAQPPAVAAKLEALYQSLK